MASYRSRLRPIFSTFAVRLLSKEASTICHNVPSYDFHLYLALLAVNPYFLPLLLPLKSTVHRVIPQRSASWLCDQLQKSATLKLILELSRPLLLHQEINKGEIDTDTHHLSPSFIHVANTTAHHGRTSPHHHVDRSRKADTKSREKSSPYTSARQECRSETPAGK